MRTSQFSPSQRRFAVLAVEAGWSVKEVCAVYGITRMTLYRWKKDLTLDVAPEVRALLAALQASERSPESLEAGVKALATLQPKKPPTRAEVDTAIAKKLRSMAAWRWNMGYRRLHKKLLAEGFAIGLGRTYRLYQAEKLAVRPMRQKADPTHQRGRYHGRFVVT